MIYQFLFFGSFNFNTGHGSRNQIPRSRKHLVNPQAPHDAGPPKRCFLLAMAQGEHKNTSQKISGQTNKIHVIQVLPSDPFGGFESFLFERLTDLHKKVISSGHDWKRSKI